MKYYYEYLGTSNGPFEIEELKGKIATHTLIWHAGLENWVKASEIPELKDFLIESPKPLPEIAADVKAIVAKAAFPITSPPAAITIAIFLVILFQP